MKNKSNKLNKTNKIIWIIIIIGILLRLVYIIKTPITERQHDVYGIKDQGHLGYIYTIYETGKLPTTNEVQFYHPPLFHYTAAGWLKLETAIGIPFDTALEGIQVLTAFFSSLILIIIYKILQKSDLNNKFKLFVMIMMAFHPTFIILSGSINNDILMFLFVFIIILYLLKWDEETNLKNTIILALATGLCVMTKLSGGIMAVPISAIFIKKIITTYKDNKKGLIKLFGLFFLFGIISLPVGLWHTIRNNILFNQPIGGVVVPGMNLYVGNHSFIQRFLSISFNELRTTYCTIPGDYNIPAYLIKTSVLGEYYYNNLYIIADLIKWLNLILITISIIAMIWEFMFNKEHKKSSLNTILIITYIINIASFISFNMDYPYSCTMDFRYIVPTVFVGTYYLCKFFEKFSDKYSNNNGFNKYIIESSQLLFMIFCFISAGMIIML